MELKQKTNKLKLLVSLADSRRTELAEYLYTVRGSESWKNTEYGSWKNYCIHNVSMSLSSIKLYVRTIKLAKEHDYGSSSVNLIVSAIGWSRLVLGLTKLGEDEFISEQEFINRYKDLNLNERVTHKGEDSELVNFNFNISKKHAEILEIALVAQGMRISDKSRTNMSSAMEKVVDGLEENF